MIFMQANWMAVRARIGLWTSAAMLVAGVSRPIVAGTLENAASGPGEIQSGNVAEQSAPESSEGSGSRSAPAQTSPPPAGQEIMIYVPEEQAIVGLTEDPLNDEETAATLAVIGAQMPPSRDNSPTLESLPQNEADYPPRPFGRNDKELAIGAGGTVSDGFTLTASVVFAWYVIDQLAPGMEIEFSTTFSDVDYPQSLTFFPFVKYVLIRSTRFAPYLLVGGGRTMEWGGDKQGFNSATGEVEGYAPVHSWLAGMGGGIITGIGSRMRIQFQLLAMYRKFDETVLRDVSIQSTSELDVNGDIVTTYTLNGEPIRHMWYPAPSFWLSFAL